MIFFASIATASGADVAPNLQELECM